MNTSKIIEAVRNYKFANVAIRIDGEVYGFDSVCSFRGDYEIPAIVIGANNNSIEFLEELFRIDEESFEGYHGDEFHYSEYDDIVITFCDSSSDGRDIIGFTYEKDNNTLFLETN